jgi:hypothetical protein
MLSAALKGKYRLVGIEPRVYVWNGLEFDLRKISLNMADKLYAMGFKHLVKVKPRKKLEV